MIEALFFYMFAAVMLGAGLMVVMMLDINFAEMRAGFQKYLPIGLVVGGILVFELVAAMYGDAFSGATLPEASEISNTRALGNVLYTKYMYLFQVAGLILLVAMIGAISLTMRRRTGVRRQVIAEQNMRRREDSVEIVDVPVGASARTVATVPPSKRER